MVGDQKLYIRRSKLCLDGSRSIADQVVLNITSLRVYVQNPILPFGLECI
ncbi:hypothetical protein VCRA2119O147_4670002 [Vibrio crassostreae]|nr:hypothetical protein VCRA2119O45_590007 [Vibrio crassostreae]CAK2359232.1 hypothetical protein VCRA2119O147_4670002 [Vibrio crassostreae]